jgi:hypothetical protein
VVYAYGADGSVCAIYIDFMIFDRSDIIEKLSHGPG